MKIPSLSPIGQRLSPRTMLEWPRRLREPAVQSSLLLAAKSALAAAVAWFLAGQVLGLPMTFMAPWSALLTVHATVYRSVADGARQVAGAVVGVLLAVAAAELIGLEAYSLGLALLLALLLGRIDALHLDGTTIATTVLFLMTAGYQHQQAMLGWRIASTLLGIAVGILVNLLVLPPLNDRSAAQHVDRVDRGLGDLLREMAASMRRGDDADAAVDWIEATRRLDHDLNRAWEVIGFARESTRMNPRQRAAELSRGELTYEEIVFRLEDGIAEARSMARTLRESQLAPEDWPEEYRSRWLDLLAELGHRVWSKESEVGPLVDDVEQLIQDMSHRDLPPKRWALFGALLSSMHNIMRTVDDVASSRRAREGDAGRPPTTEAV